MTRGCIPLEHYHKIDGLSLSYISQVNLQVNITAVEIKEKQY